MTKNIHLSIIFVIVLVFPHILWAETYTLGTYIPAPNVVANKGSFKQILFNQIAPLAPADCINGTVFRNNVTSGLVECNASGIAVPLSGVFAQAGNFIFPAQTSTNPNIRVGIGTTNPQTNLEVRGTLLSTGTVGSGLGLPYETVSGVRFLFWPSKSAFLAGWFDGLYYRNIYIGNYSSVTGGYGNLASADYTHVGGGYINQATVVGATVGGGYRNMAVSAYAAVAGGYDNRSSGTSSFVGGGALVKATADYTTVGGGNLSDATGAYSFIGGGYNHRATGYASTIGGGGSDFGSGGNPGDIGNQAIGNYSTVSGGRENLAQGIHATVGGGNQNQALGDWSTVAGGGNTLAAAGNKAVGGVSTVGGGSANQAMGLASSILGGVNNITNGLYTTIVGGTGNRTSNDYAFVGGGRANSAGAIYATVTGGETNLANSLYATIGGGQNNNTTFGDYAFIGGGYQNTANAIYSTIGGGSQNTASGSLSFIGGGQGNIASGTAATVAGGGGLGNINTASGTNAVVSGGGLNTANGTFSVISGGWTNTTSNLYSTVSGGLGNQATGDSSTVSGGAGNIASGRWGTVSGGNNNSASGGNYATVSGGNANNAIGYAAIVSGGEGNAAAGDYSWAGGRNMRLGSLAHRTFIWGQSPVAIAVPINTPDAFIIYSGNVGIGTTSPGAKLDVNGGIRAVLSPMMGGSIVKYIPGFNLLGFDIAELFDSTDTVEPGDVVVIDDTRVNQLKKSSHPYDKNAAGIVSGAPAILFEGSELKIAPAPGSFKQGTKPPVALAGRVLCKVSIENGAIEPGDLLTTSSIPGHAMKATDREKSFGAIIGKSLQGFKGGPKGEETGLVTVLVNLQ